MKISIKDFFSKCDQIRRKLPICSHLLKKSLMENFIFCVVYLNMERYYENFAVCLERFSESTFHWLKYILEIITYDTGKSQIFMITASFL